MDQAMREKLGEMSKEDLLDFIDYWRSRALALEAEIEQLDTRMNADETFLTVTEGDEEIIKFYNIPCGPWHHILGMVRN